LDVPESQIVGKVLTNMEEQLRCDMIEKFGDEIFNEV
jgi:hypothetical protein